MANPNKIDIGVIITPDPGAPNGVRFALETPLLKGDKVEFNNNNKPGFDIKFNIIDNQNTGYLFPNEKLDAMWVKPVADLTEPCPVTTPMYWPIFAAQNVIANNKTLVVHNANDLPQLFKFSLWFTKNPAQSGGCIPFDPIGDNRNGSQKVISTAAVLAIGAVALTAAVLIGFDLLGS